MPVHKIRDFLSIGGFENPNQIYHRLFLFPKTDENFFFKPIGDKTEAYEDLLMMTDVGRIENII